MDGPLDWYLLGVVLGFGVLAGVGAVGAVRNPAWVLLALAAAAQAVAACHDPEGPAHLTAVPTVLNSGDAFNVVPGSGTLFCDVRADDLDARLGDIIDVEFPGGKVVPLEVAGVFEDTPTTSGVTVPLSVLTDVGLTRSDSSLSITVEESADLDAVKLDLDDIVKELPILSVQDKVEFKELISSQVNQLLYVIYGLLALAVVIAVIGLIALTA